MTKVMSRSARAIRFTAGADVLKPNPLLPYFRRIEMSNLTIKDLPRNEEMDSNTMAPIAGGMFGLEGLTQTDAVQQAAGDQKPQIGDFQITKLEDKASAVLFSS
jgi:hypothetical protein